MVTPATPSVIAPRLRAQPPAPNAGPATTRRARARSLPRSRPPRSERSRAPSSPPAALTPPGATGAADLLPSLVLTCDSPPLAIGDLNGTDSGRYTAVNVL